MSKKFYYILTIDEDGYESAREEVDENGKHLSIYRKKGDAKKRTEWYSWGEDIVKECTKADFDLLVRIFKFDDYKII